MRGAAESAGRGRAVALVPAGGSGVRMGGSRPKQYLSLGGAPILVCTVRALARSRAIRGSVLAVPGAWLEATRGLVRRHRVPRVLEVVAGGADRQESVWRALQAAPADAALFVVHDAVRPFVEPALVEAVIAAAARIGAATCALPARETVKRVRDGLVEATLDREGLWLVQTPQAFRGDLLRQAHAKARRDGFVGTDDAVLVERLGGRVAVVPGLRHNVKITTPEDLAWARRARMGVAGKGAR
jgi:2-C-methyl-D-erythritol 4-phosphate cytidylyltransferase